MSFKADIGIIGAMQPEVEELIASLSDARTETVGGIDYYLGVLSGKRVAVAKCGIGKVFAAMCTEAMIIAYSPALIINTGVGGALKRGIKPLDIVVAQRLVQHDMDTSAIGDPKGLVSGINVIYFDSDKRASETARSVAQSIGVSAHGGIIASGDKFVASSADKAAIVENFDASVCEMEGAAIAHVCYVNAIPCCVIRAISDSADEGSSMDYMKFLPIAAKNCAEITKKLVELY